MRKKKIEFVAGTGIEPINRDNESHVLPLHHPAIIYFLGIINPDFW